jgi:hypothetical protein
MNTWLCVMRYALGVPEKKIKPLKYFEKNYVKELQKPMKLTTSDRFKLTTLNRLKLTSANRSKLTT